MVLDAIRSDPEGHQYCRGLAPYRAVPLVLRGGQDSFYSDTEAPRIAEALTLVVQTEAPILECVAVRRVGEQWGFIRMKSKAIARVTRCIDMAHLHITQEGGDTVLWPDVDDPCSFRVARLPIGDDGRVQRAVPEVPLIELAELLRFWIDEVGPMGERELFEHANRSLGFKVLGSTIRDRLEAGLRVAVERGVLERSGGTVRWRSG